MEVALALSALDWLPSPLLEIGNVLSHYGVQGHTIVDRYEEGEGVLNMDIEEWTPDARFASVVSISTLEHIGWDDDERDPEKARRVLARILNDLLAPGGHLFLAGPPGTSSSARPAHSPVQSAASGWPFCSASARRMSGAKPSLPIWELRG